MADGEAQADEVIVVRIRQGIRLREDGDWSAARDLLSAVWQSLADNGDPFHRLFAAHSIADVQDDPHQELRWDLIALEAYDQFTEQRANERGIPGGRRGVLPSLHLNLAEDYARLGQLDEARDHLDRARQNLDALDDGPYGQGIREDFDEFSQRLDPGDE